MKTVGEKIFELREQKGLSQEKLSYEIKVSRQTISNWELDETSPSAKYMQKLCEFFEVDANYFLNDNMGETAATFAHEKKEPKICVKGLKIATIITGTLLAIYALISIAIIVFVNIDSNDYSHVSSSVSVHISYEFFVILFIGLLLTVAFIILLILYLNKRKK